MMASVFSWLYDALRFTWHDPDGYNFISGPLADVTLLGGAYAIARRHNCHVNGCWRIARERVPGTSYIVCRKHHPHDAPSAEKVLEDHRAATDDHATAVSDHAAAAADRAVAASAPPAPPPDGG